MRFWRVAILIAAGSLIGTVLKSLDAPTSAYIIIGAALIISNIVTGTTQRVQGYELKDKK